MSANVEIGPVLKEMRKLAAKSPAEVDKAMGIACEHLVSEMKQEGVVPRDTGRLRDSHGFARLGQGRFQVFANTTYAAAVHERHPSKSRWFHRVFFDQAGAALKKAADELKKRLGT